MTKFTDVITDIEGTFNTVQWNDLNISTYPDNYQGSTEGEFVQLYILPGSLPTRTFSNTNVISGILLVRIFTDAGEGARRAFSIADSIDSLLAGKILTPNNTQMGLGTLSTIGLDGDNPSLFQAQYSINYTNF